MQAEIPSCFTLFSLCRVALNCPTCLQIGSTTWEARRLQLEREVERSSHVLNTFNLQCDKVCKRVNTPCCACSQFFIFVKSSLCIGFTVITLNGCILSSAEVDIRLRSVVFISIFSSSRNLESICCFIYQREIPTLSFTFTSINKETCVLTGICVCTEVFIISRKCKKLSL